MSIKSRLNKLESGNNGKFFEIERLISQGAYYDEISPDQQALYDEYRGIPMSAEVDWMRFFDENIEYPPHIRLEKNPPPPTPEELAQRIEEVRLAFEDAREEFKQGELKNKRF